MFSYMNSIDSSRRIHIMSLDFELSYFPQTWKHDLLPDDLKMHAKNEVCYKALFPRQLISI